MILQETGKRWTVGILLNRLTPPYFASVQHQDLVSHQPISWVFYKQGHLFENFTVATMTLLNVAEYPWHKWPKICSVWRNHNPVLFSLMTYYMVYINSNSTGTTSAAETAYPS